MEAFINFPQETKYNTIWRHGINDTWQWKQCTEQAENNVINQEEQVFLMGLRLFLLQQTSTFYAGEEYMNLPC